MKKNFSKVLISGMLITSLVIAVNAENIKTMSTVGTIVEETKSPEQDLIVTFGIAKDTEIIGSSASGGRGDTTYEHYGSYRYDARAYFQNIGTTTFTYEIYTASDSLVYKGILAPQKSVMLPLLQSIIKWNLSNGKGTVKIYTSDGSTCKAYFRYEILD